MKANIEEGRGGYVCHRWCHTYDRICQRNVTATITYQFLKLPTIARYIRRPLIISQFASLIRSSIDDAVTVRYHFVHHNEYQSYFSLQQEGHSAKLLLAHPLYGQLYTQLHLQMDVLNFNSVVSSHLFVVAIATDGDLFD